MPTAGSPAVGQPNGQAHAPPQLKPTQTLPPSGGKQAAAASSDFDIPLPPLTRASTLPTSLQSAATTSSSAAAAAAAARAAPAAAPSTITPKAAAANARAVPRADPYHLAPEDAFYTSIVPPWDRNAARLNNATSTSNISANASGSELHDARAARQTLRPGIANASSSSIRRSASGALLAAGGTDSRSRSRRRRRRTWKKLLWVKQTYPDNYTDQATFLENLQRNPRLKPYEFWPLVADSTVIVQHVCSVIIFVICFVGIFQDRVSPVAVVGWGSIMTCVGWLVWEWWAVHEQARGSDSDDEDNNSDGVLRRYHREPSSASDVCLSPPQQPQPQQPQQPQQRSSSKPGAANGTGTGTSTGTSTSVSTSASTSTITSRPSKLAVAPAAPAADSLSDLLPSASSSTTSLLHINVPGRQGRSDAGRAGQSSRASGLSVGLSASAAVPSHRSASSLGQQQQQQQQQQQVPATPITPGYPPPPRRPPVALRRGGRTPHRIATIKSAVLIYFTLLGLSPILKSLTRSTSSDSIWAMSFWLLAINIFFFDYSGVWVGAHKFPVASLSTNAALMASTVLASRLPSTGQVFSLTLFSIEVFGLFPVFRRYARHCSWRYHIGLTVLLVLGAGAGVGIIVTSPGAGWPWRSALGGMVVACLLAAVGMGGCSWWLIGLQKYKNEIYGPWDPARPVIISRRHWNDV